LAGNFVVATRVHAAPRYFGNAAASIWPRATDVADANVRVAPTRARASVRQFSNAAWPRAADAADEVLHNNAFIDAEIREMNAEMAAAFGVPPATSGFGDDTGAAAAVSQQQQTPTPPSTAAASTIGGTSGGAFVPPTTIADTSSFAAEADDEFDDPVFGNFASPPTTTQAPPVSTTPLQTTKQTPQTTTQPPPASSALASSSTLSSSASSSFGRGAGVAVKPPLFSSFGRRKLNVVVVGATGGVGSVCVRALSFFLSFFLIFLFFLSVMISPFASYSPRCCEFSHHRESHTWRRCHGGLCP
jgi:hypothetical protein